MTAHRGFGFAMALASLLCAGLLGCSATPLEHLTWDSLSEEETEVRLTAPTADLSLALSTQGMSDLGARMPALVELSRFLGRLIGAVAEVAKTDYSDKLAELPEVEEAPGANGEQRYGTNLYLRLACPGSDPGGAPQRDFSAGDVRLDSGELKSLDLQALLSGGEFLLSFRQCQLGPLTFDAEIPGRYTLDVSQLEAGSSDTDAPTLALAISADGVDYRGTGTPLGVLLVGCGGAEDCEDDLRASAEFKTSTGTFVVTFRALRSFWSEQKLSLRIQGAGSSSECEYTNAPGIGPRVTCESEQ